MRTATNHRGQRDVEGPRTSRRARRPTGPPTRTTPVRVDRFQQFLSMAEEDCISTTFWTEEVPDVRGDLVVSVRGHRLDVDGKAGPRDAFSQEVRIGPLPTGSGPISISVQVPDINPGQWSVSAMLRSADLHRRPPRSRRTPSKSSRYRAPLRVAAWSCRRLRDAEAGSVTTTTTLGVRRPGIVRGGWAAMVAVGVASALAVQQLLFRAAGLPALSGLTVSLLAAGAGGAGAKAWYMLLDREHGRHSGWCIQGFVAALLLALMIGGPVIGVPIGTFLDLSTPPLFLGMAIGRLGCLMAGCCGGRPTCSRFGIWCSDQRIGVKRIPTQLLESALSLATFAVTVGIAEEVHARWDEVADTLTQRFAKAAASMRDANGSPLTSRDRIRWDSVHR